MTGRVKRLILTVLTWTWGRAIISFVVAAPPCLVLKYVMAAPPWLLIGLALVIFGILAYSLPWPADARDRLAKLNTEQPS